MRGPLYVKKVYGRWVNKMKSIPEKATCETGLTPHQPECLYDAVKECTFTLLDNTQQNNMSKYGRVRFSKIKPGNYAHRYTSLPTRRRKTKYMPFTLLRGLVPGGHKAVRRMISINRRVNYDVLNGYQPLLYRR